ncbi:cobalt-precorrin-6A reductase [Clostridium carnis]
MIGFVLGTSEGKEILSLLNKHTSDVIISTATAYGGELLSKYKFKYINTKPLNYDEFKELVKRFNLKSLVDASHPYAKEVSKTLIKVCDEMNIDYIRYERKSYFDEIPKENVIEIQEYYQLKEALSNIKGNVLNTTGSNNVETIVKLGLKNRVIHRILPNPNVLQKVINSGVDIEDIIAIKGPFGYELNNGIIKEYNIKALITKESGLEGGIKEKIDSAQKNNVKVIIIKRPKITYGQVFDNVNTLVRFLIKKYYI